MPTKRRLGKHISAENRNCNAKRHEPEEIITKLRQVDVLGSQGSRVAEAIRSIGVTEVTYYRWRQEYGGLKSDQVKRMKDLARLIRWDEAKMVASVAERVEMA